MIENPKFNELLDKIKKAVVMHLRPRIDGVDLLWVGLPDVYAKHQALWIKVKCDDERDMLSADQDALNLELRRVIQAAGYPEMSVGFVNFPVESQETVDRDYDGSWFSALH